MIRTFLFDLGNVLLHFSHERMWTQMAGVCGCAPEAMRRLLFEEKLQLQYERGEFSEESFRHAFEHRFGVRIDAGAFYRATADIFTLNAPMLPILRSLRGQGRRLVLLSNTCASHIRWVREQFPVLAEFDDCVLSCDVGAVKPEPRIFDEALRRIRCVPQECVYTDDIAAYVSAGRERGLHGVVFTDAAAWQAELAQRGLDRDH